MRMARHGLLAALMTFAVVAANAQTTAQSPQGSSSAAGVPTPVGKTPREISRTTPAAPAATPAPGDVWVNSASTTYHCPGTKYFGKTKKGSYMTEAAAKSAGYHANGGKACSAS